MSNPRRVSSELPSRAPSELPSPANEMPTTPDFAMSGLQSHINTPNEFPGIPDELDWSALDEAISGLGELLRYHGEFEETD